MSKLSDPEYLLTEQYQNAANLKARISLHENFSTNKYGWFLWVFDQFDLPSDCRILELGCGPGDLWLENMPRIPPGWAITLSDFSTGMLKQAQANLHNQPHGFTFELIDAQSIPYEDQSFETVIASHMLFHVPDHALALSEIRRVLRPGGRLYATTIGGKHIGEIPALVRKFEPNLGDDYQDEINMFTLENGCAQLKAWFSDIAVQRYDDNLVVTEAAPLVDYVLSGIRLGVGADRQVEFTEFIAGELAQNNGVIRITKDSGLFIVS